MRLMRVSFDSVPLFKRPSLSVLSVFGLVLVWFFDLRATVGVFERLID